MSACHSKDRVKLFLWLAQSLLLHHWTSTPQPPCYESSSSRHTRNEPQKKEQQQTSRGRQLAIIPWSRMPPPNPPFPPFQLQHSRLTRQLIKILIRARKSVEDQRSTKANCGRIRAEPKGKKGGRGRVQHQATMLTSAPRGQTESEGFLLCQAEGTRLGSAQSAAGVMSSFPRQRCIIKKPCLML